MSITSESVGSESAFAVEDLLEMMTIYNHPQEITVSQLCKKHRVLLVMLRYFECTFCQGIVAKIAANYRQLIQMNTIPVLVHQESVESGMRYFTEFKVFEPYQPLVQNLFRVSASALTDIKLYKLLNLGQQSLFDKPLQVLKRQNHLVSNGMKPSRVIAKENRKYSFQMPGIFVVEKMKVTNEFSYMTVSDNPDIFKLIIDPKRNSLNSEAFCDLSSCIEEAITSTTKSLDKRHSLTSSPVFDPYNDLPEYIPERKRKSIFSGCFQPEDDSMEIDVQNIDLEDIQEIQKEIVRCKLIPVRVDEVIENKEALRYFKMFCAKEASIEVIFFMEAVQQYEELVKLSEQGEIDKQGVVGMANQIINTFFRVGAVNEINISNRIRQRVLENYQNHGAVPNLFKPATAEVITDQLIDTFSRFKKSDDYLSAAQIIMATSRINHQTSA